MEMKEEEEEQVVWAQEWSLNCYKNLMESHNLSKWLL